MVILLTGCQQEPAPSSSDTRPNILLIVADDLGYTDLGAYGGEIETPNLDRLAEEGLRFTNFYAAQTCSPARAMLLTGVDSHLAGLGTMAERMHPRYEGQQGYEGYLNQDVVTVATLLRDSGYNTYMTGKWHLGHEIEQGPVARGFERAFGQLTGGSFHMSRLPHADPEMTGIEFTPYRKDTEKVTAPGDFYSTRFFTTEMIDYIEEGRSGGKPFFAYLAYTAPHFPLQAPAAKIRKYRGRYDAGFDVIGDARISRMRSLGLVGDSVSLFPAPGQENAWRDLDESGRAFEARRMEVYAAMVDEMDEYIGRLFNYLRDIGEYDNTFVVFISDNGAEGNDIARTIRTLGDWPERCCDNSLENMGAGNSYIWQGPGWARVSSGPLRRFKSSAAEGGIRVPAIVSGRGVTSGVSEAVATVRDLTPTFLELAGIEHPGDEYHGRPVHRPSGASLLAHLADPSAPAHPPTRSHGWELNGRQSLRAGQWKILWDSAPFGIDRWTLHDLEADPNEIRDLSEQEPDIFRRMLENWNEYQSKNNVISVH